MAGLLLRVNDHGLLERLSDAAPPVILALLPEAWTQPEIWPHSQIAHTNAGPRSTSWTDLQRYMARPDVGAESHVQGTSAGELVQFMPFTRRADCNFRANRWWDGRRWLGAASYETQDNGAASLGATPWTPAQFEALAQAMAAVAVKYGLETHEPPTWDASGIGHHSLYPAPLWTNVPGKTCPGPARIAQMPALRARVEQLAWTPPPQPQTSPPPISTPITATRKDEPMIRIIHFGTEGSPDWVALLVRPNASGQLRVEWLDGHKLAMWRSLGVAEVTWRRPQEIPDGDPAEWVGHNMLTTLIVEVGTRGDSPFLTARPDPALHGVWLQYLRG